MEPRPDQIPEICLILELRFYILQTTSLLKKPPVIVLVCLLFSALVVALYCHLATASGLLYNQKNVQYMSSHIAYKHRKQLIYCSSSTNNSNKWNKPQPCARIVPEFRSVVIEIMASITAAGVRILSRPDKVFGREPKLGLCIKIIQC